jgi:hypothetical protein
MLSLKRNPAERVQPRIDQIGNTATECNLDSEAEDLKAQAREAPLPICTISARSQRPNCFAIAPLSESGQAYLLRQVNWGRSLRINST